ncbi:unnamed protein product [Closterium sp. NIES-64]|nr:unnamed protein product [Closterium sp. NIES-64]CAI6001033.1 unnamed protein product [Closterium sp. NIES-64]
MLSSPLQLCSPADSSPSHRAFLSGPSPPTHALAFVPARLVSLSISPCSSLAAAASLATVPMLLPFLAADDLRASACLRRLLFPAAAGREASGTRCSPSFPIALAGLTSVPPCRALLAAGRASLMSWAPPRVLLPAASGGWLRVARPPILPYASAACPAIVRHLRPGPLEPGASRVRGGQQKAAPGAAILPLTRAVPLPPFCRVLLASPQRRHARPSPAAPADVTSPRNAPPGGLRRGRVIPTASLPPVDPQRRGLYLREMPAFAASAPEIARARVTAHLVLVPPPGD